MCYNGFRSNGLSFVCNLFEKYKLICTPKISIFCYNYIKSSEIIKTIAMYIFR